MTDAPHNNPKNADARLETLDDLVARADGNETNRSARQTRIEKAEGGPPDDLTDHEARLKLADLAGQIYLRAWHRNTAMLTPAEASVIAGVVMGLATSDQALRIYDDVLEGTGIMKFVDTIKAANAKMQEKMADADEAYAKREAKAWTNSGPPI